MAGKNTRKSGPVTDGRDARGRFTKGNAGKPRGARHRATQAVERLLDGRAHALTEKVVEVALQGDTTALRLCLERIAPVRRESPVTLDLPVVESASDLPKAMAAVLGAVGGGRITPGEAERLARLIDAFGRGLELQDIEERLRRLEEEHEED